MRTTMVVTGSALSCSAQDFAGENGIRLVNIAPYSTSREIAHIVKKENAEAIIVRAATIDEYVINHCPNLKVIAKHGVGVDTIDVSCATKKGLPVLIANGANARSVAEHALALILSLSRAIPYLNQRMLDGYWDKTTSFSHEITGKTLGLIGLGNIGRQLVELMDPFQMKILAFDPFARQLPLTVRMVDNLEELIRLSDIVSLHCPLNTANKNLIDAEKLDWMKKNAILINTARGGLIDQEALANSLHSKKIAGAALDSFPQEPPKSLALYNGLENVILTPHIGANTAEAADRVGKLALKLAYQVIIDGYVEENCNINPDYKHYKN